MSHFLYQITNLKKTNQTEKKLKYFRPEFTLEFASWHFGHLDDKLHAFRDY